MSPCICIDDTHPMFKVIKGSHYWQPVIEKKPKNGDLLYFEIKENGVVISETNNENLSFIFMMKSDFYKHFEDISFKRDNKINDLLS
jgi:hypothetical protein